MDVGRWLDRLRGARFVPDEGRWVMLDVETSGLDPGRSELLAIAAIALRVDWAEGKLVIDLADSFEVVLRQAKASARDSVSGLAWPANAAVGTTSRLAARQRWIRCV